MSAKHQSWEANAALQEAIHGSLTGADEAQVLELAGKIALERDPKAMLIRLVDMTEAIRRTVAEKTKGETPSQ